VRVLIDYLAKAFARDFRSRLGIDQYRYFTHQAGPLDRERAILA